MGAGPPCLRERPGFAGTAQASAHPPRAGPGGGGDAGRGGGRRREGGAGQRGAAARGPRGRGRAPEPPRARAAAEGGAPAWRGNFLSSPPASSPRPGSICSCDRHFYFNTWGGRGEQMVNGSVLCFFFRVIWCRPCNLLRSGRLRKDRHVTFRLSPSQSTRSPFHFVRELEQMTGLRADSRLAASGCHTALPARLGASGRCPRVYGKMGGKAHEIASLKCFLTVPGRI